MDPLAVDIRIGVAALVPLLLHWAWYQPQLFGSVWMRLARVMPESIESRIELSILIPFLSWCMYALAAAGLYFVGNAWGVLDLAGSIRFAVGAWAGFVLPFAVLKSIRPHEHPLLTAIDAGYWLAALLSMSIVLAV